MQKLPTPQDLMIKAAQGGITMTEACHRAKLNRTFFIQWKFGRNSPSIANVQKLLDVLDEAIREKKKNERRQRA